MNEEKRNKINKLLDLLSVEEKAQLIIEIAEDKNNIIYDFLEKQGFLNVSYSVEYEKKLAIITETNASIDLWYKDINKTWIINMFQINKMLSANWE